MGRSVSFNPTLHAAEARQQRLLREAQSAPPKKMAQLLETFAQAHLKPPLEALQAFGDQLSRCDEDGESLAPFEVVVHGLNAIHKLGLDHVNLTRHAAMMLRKELTEKPKPGQQQTQLARVDLAIKVVQSCAALGIDALDLLHAAGTKVETLLVAGEARKKDLLQYFEALVNTQCDRAAFARTLDRFVLALGRQDVDWTPAELQEVCKAVVRLRSKSAALLARCAESLVTEEARYSFQQAKDVVLALHFFWARHEDALEAAMRVFVIHHMVASTAEVAAVLVALAELRVRTSDGSPGGRLFREIAHRVERKFGTWSDSDLAGIAHAYGKCRYPLPEEVVEKMAARLARAELTKKELKHAIQGLVGLGHTGKDFLAEVRDKAASQQAFGLADFARSSRYRGPPPPWASQPLEPRRAPALEW